MAIFILYKVSIYLLFPAMTQGPNPPKAGFYDHEFKKLMEISPK